MLAIAPTQKNDPSGEGFIPHASKPNLHEIVICIAAAIISRPK
jgi:hypothetical protein